MMAAASYQQLECQLTADIAAMTAFLDTAQQWANRQAGVTIGSLPAF